MLRNRDIRRIASHTRGEYSPLDVEHEAWLLACDLAGVGDVVAALANPEFQDTLLRYLYQNLVRYRERKIRTAVRLDQEDEDSPDKYDLISASNVDNTCNPLETLIASESSTLHSEQACSLDSVAGAYVFLLQRHGGNMRTLADYLSISVSHCYRCCAKARHLAVNQHPIPYGAMGGTESSVRPWRKYRARRAMLRANSQIPTRTTLLL